MLSWLVFPLAAIFQLIPVAVWKKSLSKKSKLFSVSSILFHYSIFFKKKSLTISNYRLGLDPAGVPKWMDETERIREGDAKYVQVI